MVDHLIEPKSKGFGKLGETLNFGQNWISLQLSGAKVGSSSNLIQIW